MLSTDFSLQMLPHQKSITRKHHCIQPSNPLTRHEDDVVVGASSALEDLGEEILKIVTVSTSDKFSNLSRIGVFHFRTNRDPK